MLYLSIILITMVDIILYLVILLCLFIVYLGPDGQGRTSKTIEAITDSAKTDLLALELYLPAIITSKRSMNHVQLIEFNSS